MAEKRLAGRRIPVDGRASPSTNPVVQEAHRLLGKETPLDRALITRLADGPLRYRELKDLIDGRSDNVLTVALDRLEDRGLVRRKLDVRSKPVVPRYDLSELGRQVLAAMQLLEAAARDFDLT